MEESLPSLEDLIREIREVPSPHVRLAGLAATRIIIEQQLDAARSAELKKLQRKHAEDGTHPDDASIDMYELEVQVTHLLPKVLRGGFLLALWSTLEACTKDLAAYAGRESGKAVPKGLFRYGSFLDSSQQAFTEILGIDAFASDAERAGLARLGRVRAALVHHNGNVEGLPEDLRDGHLAALEAEGLYLEKDLHHRYFVPTSEYVERNLALVDAHLRGLADRVQSAVRR